MIPLATPAGRCLLLDRPIRFGVARESTVRPIAICIIIGLTKMGTQSRGMKYELENGKLTDIYKRFHG